MSKKYKYMGVLVFLLIIGAIMLARYLVNAPGKYINDINRAYKGIIINKFNRRGTQLTIKTTDDKTFDVAILSGDLIKESGVGDSIEKLPGDNYVILNKQVVKEKLLYRHIPDYIRNDYRWPAEWKEKWLDQPVPHFSLEGIYIGDTALLNKGSYVIKVKNNGTEEMELSFKRVRRLTDPLSDTSDNKKPRLVLADKDHRQRCELLLSNIYPSVLPLKGNDSIILGFIDDCSDLLNITPGSDSLTQQAIRTFFTNNTLYCYNLMSPADTIVVSHGQDFPIRLRELFIEDLKNFK